MTTITARTRTLEGNELPLMPVRVKVTIPEKLDIPLPPPSRALSEILSVDQATPDNHVPRDPRLIRLTGIHPFNVEPTLTSLFNEGIHYPVGHIQCELTRVNIGFLTSIELFYVRNHGPVPRVRDHDIPTWELRVEGLVSFHSIRF